MTPKVLNPGDIAIVGYITNGSPDSFSFVPLVDLTEGTEIYFTDNGWMSSNFRENEGTIKFTAQSDIAAGTVINSTDTSSFTGNLVLNQGGEQIAAVQSNNLDNPLSSDFTAIYQIDNTGAFEDASNSTEGNVITGLSQTENTAVLLDNTSTYAAFNIDAIPNGTREDWLVAINNPENWTFGSETSLPTNNIEVIPEIDSLVVTNTNDNGEGSLRQAIENANNFLGADIITFASNLSGQTITLTSGELLITDAVNIQGLGAEQLTISGNNTSRVFKIDSNSDINVTIESLTITGGQTSAGDDNNDDGAGIWNRENLTLKNVVVIGNQAVDDGGGIRNDGEINIINSTVADNTSVGTSFFSGGGGLINTQGASATVVNSTFSGNTAENGGGIRNDGTLNIYNTTLSDNNSIFFLGGGGAIANSLGIVNIQSSTITKNKAVGSGAGISTTSIVNVTNSIIAANTDEKDIAAVSSQGFTGSFNSNGNNLIGNGDGVSAFTADKEDIVGTAAAPINPLLGSLQDNGGATQTHALLADSPAINAGNNTKLVEDNFDLDGDNNNTEQIPLEQRGEGFERIIDAVVDIGAYEYNMVNEAPEITADQIFSINENSETGTVISPVAATDANNDTLVNWEILEGNLDVDGDGKNAFAINSTTGEITVNDSGDLDFEKNPSFQLKVSVSDGINSSNPGIVTINLNDVTGSQIDGTSENNRLKGSSEDDIIDGKAGNDYLYGKAGNDTLIGGSGNDNLYGGEGDDSIDGGEGIDTLRETADVSFTLTDNSLTGKGTDTIASIERVVLTGGNSANFIKASDFSGNIYLYGGAGNDTLQGGSQNDFLYGGEGDDEINGGSRHSNISGGKGNDIINGGKGVDTLRETTEFDFTLTNTSLSGVDGIDQLISIERAVLSGRNSDNIIDASAFTGGTYLYGRGGDDTLIGGSGNDHIYGEQGNDSIDGGEGIDSLRETSDTNFILTDTSLTGNGTDTIANIERAFLAGGDRANIIVASGFTGNAYLYGRAGNDTLTGGTNNDFLYGEQGNDLINGGLGNDRLYGGDGNDIFVLSSVAGKDTIYDFEDGFDKLDLSDGLIFENLTIAVSGSNTNILQDNQILATLIGVDSTLIDAADFTNLNT